MTNGANVKAREYVPEQKETREPTLYSRPNNSLAGFLVLSFRTPMHLPPLPSKPPAAAQLYILHTLCASRISVAFARPQRKGHHRCGGVVAGEQCKASDGLTLAQKQLKQLKPSRVR